MFSKKVEFFIWKTAEVRIATAAHLLSSLKNVKKFKIHGLYKYTAINLKMSKKRIRVNSLLNGGKRMNHPVPTHVYQRYYATQRIILDDFKSANSRSSYIFQRSLI